MKRVGVVWLILTTLLIVGLLAKSDNANSKSKNKCNNGLGNDKEKCYEGSKADSINGNAYGLSKNKFAVSSDDSSADEETQQKNEEKLIEFEEKHKTIAENFMLIYEVPSEKPQYVNGEVVSRVYNLGTKSSARAIGEDNISGYMVMTLNEGDVPIKAYSFDNGGFENLPPFYREFLNLRLYEINKIYELVESNSSLRGVKKRHPLRRTLRKCV